MSARVVEIPLPGYAIDKKPNYTILGKRVDKEIVKHFPDGTYLVRAIGSSDHQKLSLNQLADVILKKGTDKYDPKRKAVAHEEFSGFDYDIQASKITIKNKKLVIPKDYKYKTEFGDIMWHFYEHTPFDRGYAVRIDLLLLYDPTQLQKARKTNLKIPPLRRKLIQYLYKFKNPEQKKDALIGIVKILK